MGKIRGGCNGGLLHDDSEEDGDERDGRDIDGICKSYLDGGKERFHGGMICEMGW